MVAFVDAQCNLLPCRSSTQFSCAFFPCRSSTQFRFVDILLKGKLWAPAVLVFHESSISQPQQWRSSLKSLNLSFSFTIPVGHHLSDLEFKGSADRIMQRKLPFACRTSVDQWHRCREDRRRFQGASTDLGRPQSLQENADLIGKAADPCLSSTVPRKIRRPEQSSSLEKQALSRESEPEPNPCCENSSAPFQVQIA